VNGCRILRNKREGFQYSPLKLTVNIGYGLSKPWRHAKVPWRWALWLWRKNGEIHNITLDTAIGGACGSLRDNWLYQSWAPQFLQGARGVFQVTIISAVEFPTCVNKTAHLALRFIAAQDVNDSLPEPDLCIVFGSHWCYAIGGWDHMAYRQCAICFPKQGKRVAPSNSRQPKPYLNPAKSSSVFANSRRLSSLLQAVSSISLASSTRPMTHQ